MIPKELQDYISSLPPSSVNNARQIIRTDWQKAEKMTPVSAANWLNEKYNLGLDPDRTGSDYGDRPVYNNND